MRRMTDMNVATIARKVIKVESLKGKPVGISFILGYQQHWANGSVQEIAIRCYVSGAERIEKLRWLKAGEVVLAHGEVTDRGSVYALQTEHLSKPERVPGENDESLAGMQRTSCG
jgi:hypothetical protein